MVEILLAAFALGSVHAVEVDHLVAVSAFVSGEPKVGRSMVFGLRWGAGHAGVVLIVGGVLAWTGVSLPERFTGIAELAVGIALVALGVWSFRAAGRLHLHAPSTHGDHGHLHTHPHQNVGHEHVHRHDGGRWHRHLPTAVGALHGLAGTAPVIALLPVTLIESRVAAIGYLAMFGIGTLAAMALYAGLAAAAIRRATSTPVRVKAVARVVAVATSLVGAVWLVRTVSRWQ